MSHYFDKNSGSWVIQAQRTTPSGVRLRKCQRLKGTANEVRAAEKTMMRQLEAEVSRLQLEHNLEQRKEEAASVLGLTLRTATKSRASGRPPTLQEYLIGRWAEHAKVVQGATTRRTTRTHVAYLTFYLGELRLDEIDQAAVARLRESLLRDGPRSFKLNRDGEPRKPRTSRFTPTAVNRIMSTLSAALRLAKYEGVLDRAPRVDMLPADDSQPIVPPSDAELAAILKTGADFTEAAPFMIEAIELAAETGMRAGELFTRTWSSVDFQMGDTGAIRVERQPRVKMVDGRPWTPKHKKSRIIPLTPRAREVLLALRERVPNAPDDPVIPSRGGCPYVRLEAAPDKSGIGYFPAVVEAATITGHVRWHDLRHYFAVRALLRGVPIAVVSAWLGHSDINLTVKRYGRWAAEAREQWAWAKRMNEPADAIAPRPALVALGGGNQSHP
jgi:integrase